MSTRPIPDDVWSSVESAVFRGDEESLTWAVTTIAPYSYDSRVRDQLRRLAKSEKAHVRDSALAVLRRQRATDTSARFGCASCASLDPANVTGSVRRNDGVPEYKSFCPVADDYVWPTFDKCPQYAAASRDTIQRDYVKRNHWGKPTNTLQFKAKDKRQA